MKSEEVRGKRKMQIYVDGNAVRSGNGQKEYPFQTISEAAKIAKPGDEVLTFAPYFPEYQPYVKGAGAKLTIVPAD